MLVVLVNSLEGDLVREAVNSHPLSIDNLGNCKSHVMNNNNLFAFMIVFSVGLGLIWFHQGKVQNVTCFECRFALCGNLVAVVGIMKVITDEITEPST